MSDRDLSCLPIDYRDGLFLGRVAAPDGPHVIVVRDGLLYDLTETVASVSGAIARRMFAGGRLIGAVEQGLPDSWHLMSPVDLQCIRAAGVTFARSAIERVIEERAGGDPAVAATLRTTLESALGAGIRSVVPGSAPAQALKRALIAERLWSPYLEVAIGPDAEVFAKAPVLASVGHGAQIGIRTDSTWNNPEPEVVLVVGPDGAVAGATLGNDVNLRDFEGRSALLLAKAKDNRASCAVGPFIRLFDDHFGMDDVRQADVSLLIEGLDHYRLEGTSRMNEISRDPLDLVQQTLSEHDYPDGFALFCGTMFAPTQDRDVPGGGFTHRIGDRVTIRSLRLGRLTNTVTTSHDAPPWQTGIAAFVRNLAERGLADRI